ncbi:uncharacterized protein LOC114305789 [Camellia sinensis]|uniref:uncharacterized protein LOC114305789 n=1 Tax=Camellia sinensis TaxID=4442 RepID=UPI001036F041|nr:uncharacterized protein LOC114305789 [Camellia sinensis]
MVIDSVGSVGGLLCIWKSSVFQLSQCYRIRHCVILFGILLPNFKCVLVNMHAPNEVNERHKFWSVLHRLKPVFSDPWCLAGYFNEIRNIGERKGCSRRDKGIKEFNQFIENLEVVDLPMMGRQFTWCNASEGERWSRIDRVLLSTEWLERVNLKLWGLKRSVSDHCPLLLLEDERDWGRRPFRFLNAWILHPKFGSLVKKSWEESAFSGWLAKEELHAIDLVAESRSLEENEIRRRREVRKELWTLSRREEWMWKQKSRLNCNLQGDKNTRFFHIVATSRHNKNLLNLIEIDRVTHKDPCRVKQEHDEVSDGLVAPFSEKDIWRAVKESDSNKAPGPDGFNKACF